MDAAATRPGDRPVGRRECNGQDRCKRNGDGRSDKQDNDIRRDASGEQSASGRTAGRRKGGSRGRSDSRRAETISAKDEGIGKRSPYHDRQKNRRLEKHESAERIFRTESDPRDRGTNERKTKGREVLGDPQFRRGMAISPLWPAIVQNNGGFEKTNTDTIRFGRRSGKPVWQMAQWASRYDLGGTPPVRQADGSVAYANEGKRIVRSADGTLTLDITTSTEYRSPRTADGAWPHLLIQQDFKHRPNIGRIRHLYFAMDLRIEHCERRMSDEQYDESLHTAQSPFYFFMRNTNPRSPDYGLSLWVGVPSFDYRYERLSDEEYVQWDIGTATYIYAIPPRSIWGDVSFHDREWHSARLDLLPLIRRGVAAMQAKGQFVHTMPEDLELTGMNFGWEVPGTFDAGLQIRNLSIRIVE